MALVLTPSSAGDLAGSKYVSVVGLDQSGGNPCVNPTFAAATVLSSGSANARLTSGVMQGAGKVLTVVQQNGNLMKLGAGNAAGIQAFAVCYTDGDGGANDNGWRDSYIRVKMTHVETFGTKGVSHRAFGQIPAHDVVSLQGTPKGLLYTLSGTIPAGPAPGVAGSHIALVDATLGALDPSTSGFNTGIHNPCECSDSGCTTLATASEDVAHSGKVALTQDELGTDILPTDQLTSDRLYALCYSSSSNPSSAHTGYFFDSGIRLTVPKVIGIEFSGYSMPTAMARNKRTRLLQSRPFELQPPTLVAANVLPQMADMPLVYSGDMAPGGWISLVEAPHTLTLDLARGGTPHTNP